MGDRNHDIEKYLRGQLSTEEMHALEKEALNDPFLAEALEGIEEAGPDNFLYDLHTIRRSVHDRLRSNSRKKTKTIRIWAWAGAIAATLLLIAVSGFIVLSLIREQAARRQAMSAQPEPMPAEFLEKDTLVIPLPAETPVKSKAAQRSIALAPAAGARLQQSAPLASDEETSLKAPADDQESIGKETDEEETQDRIPDVTESIAASDRSDATEVTSDVVAREEEPVSRSKKESAPEIAGSQRSAARAPVADTGNVIKGKVVDSEGEALPGVNVLIKGTNIGTVTDVNGQYELRVPPGNSNLVFAFVGFQSQDVVITGQQDVNVALSEEVASLSEVVVIGYSSDGSTSGNTSFRVAEPAGGRNDFKSYLERAVKYPAEAAANKIEGRVTVQFTVEADGQLTNFTILKSIGSGTAEALMDAIKAGPAWKPSMQGNQPVADKVKVRYRFKLPE